MRRQIFFTETRAVTAFKRLALDPPSCPCATWWMSCPVQTLSLGDIEPCGEVRVELDTFFFECYILICVNQDAPTVRLSPSAGEKELEKKKEKAKGKGKNKASAKPSGAKPLTLPKKKDEGKQEGTGKRKADVGAEDQDPPIMKRPSALRRPAATVTPEAFDASFLASELKVLWAPPP